MKNTFDSGRYSERTLAALGGQRVAEGVGGLVSRLPRTTFKKTFKEP